LNATQSRRCFWTTCRVRSRFHVFIADPLYPELSSDTRGYGADQRVAAGTSEGIAFLAASSRKYETRANQSRLAVKA
jgi:hypothetical protein